MIMTTEQKKATAKLCGYEPLIAEYIAHLRHERYNPKDKRIFIRVDECIAVWNPETNAAQLMELVEAVKDKGFMVDINTLGKLHWHCTIASPDYDQDDVAVRGHETRFHTAILAALLQLPELAETVKGEV